MSDATSLAEDFASGRSDPVQALEQALDQASRSTSVFIALTAERARREAEASAARWRAGQPLSVFDGVPPGLERPVRRSRQHHHRRRRLPPRSARRVARCPQRGPVVPCRDGQYRQDQPQRIGLFRVGPEPAFRHAAQSPWHRPGAHSRRLVVRFGGGCCCGYRADRHGHRHRRFDPHSGGAQRPGGLPQQQPTLQPRRCVSPGPFPRQPWPVDPQRAAMPWPSTTCSMDVPGSTVPAA